MNERKSKEKLNQSEKNNLFEKKQVKRYPRYKYLPCLSEYIRLSPFRR